MTDKTRTMSVRIPNEVASEFEEWLKNEGYTLRELITGVVEGRVTLDGPKNEISDGKSQKIRGLNGVNTKKPPKYDISEAVLDDLATMKDFAGGSVEEMIRRFDVALNEGSIIYEDGRFMGMPDIYLGDFKEKCREYNLDPQTVLDKWVKEMRC